MTLENLLLERLSEWKPPPGRQELQVAAKGWSATVTAERSDALGCLLWELNVRRDGTDEVNVQSWAAAATERVTGLMEPLKVVEVDTVRGQAQLRSNQPAQRSGKSFYYELLLSAIGHAVLRRFQTVNGTPGREQVAFALTHEALARVAGDVTTAAG